MIRKIKYVLVGLIMVSGPVIASPSRDELTCLYQVMHHEARGEADIGKIAVGHVVLNRVRRGLWGRSICSVVHSPDQFQNFHYYRNVPRSTISLAESVYHRRVSDPTNGALNFRVHSGRRRGIVIGNHVFF